MTPKHDPLIITPAVTTSLYESFSASLSRFRPLLNTGALMAGALFGSAVEGAEPMAKPLSGAERGIDRTALPLTQEILEARKAGIEVGKVLGKIEVLTDLMADDVKRIDSRIKESSDAEVKQSWLKAKLIFEGRLEDIQRSVGADEQKIDGPALLKQLSETQELLKGWEITSRRSAHAAQGASVPGIPGRVDVRVADPISWAIYEEYFPMIRSTLDSTIKSFQDGGPIKGFPKTDPAQLEKARELRQSIRGALKSDSDRILEKREADRAERQKKQNPQER